MRQIFDNRIREANIDRIREINRIRILNQKSGRTPMPKIITCGYCSDEMECGHKKIRVHNVGWKQWVPQRQYCSSNCSKPSLNFKVRLHKKLIEPKDQSEYFTAQYCLWKMLGRTPIKELSEILSTNFERARPNVIKAK